MLSYVSQAIGGSFRDGHFCRQCRGAAPDLRTTRRAAEPCAVTEARADLWTVPTRGVPKNCLRQLKWRLIFDKLVKKLKTRVTTDDSICPEADGVQVDSRNTTIDRVSWGNVGLPGPRTLAEADPQRANAAAHERRCRVTA